MVSSITFSAERIKRFCPQRKRPEFLCPAPAAQVSFPRADVMVVVGQEDALYQAQFGQYQS